MKSYIKTAAGLSPQNTTCIKVYSSLEKVNEAIASGELKENELFATCVSSGIHDDIVGDVQFLLSVISPDASPSNKLVTLTDINTDYATKNWVHDTFVQCCDYSSDLADLTTNIESRVTQTCFNNELSNIRSDISDRVSCSDYSSDLTNFSNNLVNKVTCSDYQTWQIDLLDSINSDFCCRVQCYDYNQYVASNDNNISNINTTLSNKVTCSDYNTALSNKVTCSDYNTKINALENCISSLTTTINSLTCRIADLESCAGLDCVGTLTSDNFEYDGSGNLNIVL